MDNKKLKSIIYKTAGKNPHLVYLARNQLLIARKKLFMAIRINHEAAKKKRV